MSTVDLKGTNYEVAGRLEYWARDWELGKDWLLCRHCGGIQTFHGAASGKPFSAHKDKCSGLKGGQRYLLHELRSVFDTLSAVVP